MNQIPKDEPELTKSRNKKGNLSRVKISLCMAVVICSILPLQDYYDKYSLPITIIFIALVLTTLYGSAGKGEKIPAFEEKSTGLGKFIPFTIISVCWVFSFFPSLHSTLTVSGVVIVTTITSCILIALGKTPLQKVAVMQSASYLLMLSSPVLYMEHVLFPYRTMLLQGTFSLSFLLICLPIFHNLKPYITLTLIIIAGTILRTVGIVQWELDPAHRDMIPLIHNACLSFLHGHNPYKLYWCGHDLPLTYLPVMWLMYLPFVALKLDPRAGSVLFSVIAAILIYLWQGKKQETKELSVFLATLFYSNVEVFWVAIFAESAAFWSLAFLFLYFIIKKKSGWVCLVFSLMLPARHFSLLFLPYLVLWFYSIEKERNSPQKIRLLKTTIYTLVPVAIFFTITIPFIHGNSKPFFFGVLHWLTNFGRAHPTWWTYELSLNPIFYRYQAEKLILPFQVSIYILTIAVAMIMWKKKGFHHLWYQHRCWHFLTFSYTAFLILNPLIWRHLYPAQFGLLLFLISSLYKHKSENTKSVPDAIDKFFEIVLFKKPFLTTAIMVAITTWCSVYFLRTLYHFYNREEIKKEAMEVYKLLRKGDLVVDYSYLNAWPILEGTPFGHKAFTKHFTFSMRLRSQFPPQFKRIVFFTSGKHFVYPDDIPDLLTYAKLMEIKNYPQTRLFIFRNPLQGKIRAKLSDNFSWIKGAWLYRKGKTITGYLEDDRYKFRAMDPRYFAGIFHFNIVFAKRKCILVSSPSETWLEVQLNIPFDAHNWLLTALDDSSLWPGLEPYRIKVRAEKYTKTFTHPNTQGLFVWNLGKHARGEKLFFRFSSRRKKRRYFCFDVVLTQ